jgi:UDP-3-O-[3-hydroxymyristoyl] N-acetylglucosamine deacetylase
MLSATLAHPVEVTGRGLFSGEPCRMRIEPAPPCTGLAIRAGGRTVPLTIEYVIERPSCTVIQSGDEQIAVVEHLLAALWAAGIDTAAIMVDGPEVPNSDGSSLPIYETLANAGRIQAGPRIELRLVEPIRVEENGSFLQIEPAAEFSVDYSFSHAELGEQRYAANLSREAAASEILPARSFITDNEARAAWASGALLNTSVEDALVLMTDGGGVEPASPLRFPDEFARHKVLDMLGDLYLAPFEWTGKITAFRSGHKLNRAMARELMKVANL